MPAKHTRAESLLMAESALAVFHDPIHPFMEIEGIGQDGRFYIERFRQSHHNIGQTNTRPFWQPQRTLGVALRFAANIGSGPGPGARRRPKWFTEDSFPHDGCQGGYRIFSAALIRPVTQGSARRGPVGKPNSQARPKRQHCPGIF